MANFEVCNWFFKKSPFVCCENGTSKKNTVIIRLMSLFGSYILGIFFFMSKYKSLMILMMSFSFANDKYTRFFFLTSWTWTKNGVLNFKCTTFNLHRHFSNVSQFPFMNTSSNFIYNDKAITCLKKKTPSLLSLVSTSKKRTSHFRR